MLIYQRLNVEKDVENPWRKASEQRSRHRGFLQIELLVYLRIKMSLELNRIWVICSFGGHYPVDQYPTSHSFHLKDLRKLHCSWQLPPSQEDQLGGRLVSMESQNLKVEEKKDHPILQKLVDHFLSSLVSPSQIHEAKFSLLLEIYCTGMDPNRLWSKWIEGGI